MDQNQIILAPKHFMTNLWNSGQMVYRRWNEMITAYLKNDNMIEFLISNFVLKLIDLFWFSSVALIEIKRMHRKLQIFETKFDCEHFLWLTYWTYQTYWYGALWCFTQI